MPRPKKSDTATVADWSILELPEVYAAIQRSASGLAHATGQDADDLMQEGLLALGVRPTEVRAAYDKGGAALVAHKAWGFMHSRTLTERKRTNKFPSLEQMTECYED